MGVNSKYARLHFPKVKYGGRVLHLSVVDAVITQIVDSGTDGVACRSSSNKAIPCDVPVLDADNEFIYSEAEANSLNEKGITTVNYIGGGYRLWGAHMANYDYDTVASIEGKDLSDATIRMQIYLDNTLKTSHVESIDAPLTRREIDNILSNINIWLNSLVNSGYLLKGECYYDDGNNSTAELADGNLVLDILHTETPNGKSISFKLQYDANGIEKIYEVTEE
jgi:phage tail sheath protein FI